MESKAGKVRVGTAASAVRRDARRFHTEHNKGRLNAGLPNLQTQMQNLLLRRDRVLRGLCEIELRGRLGLDLDRFAGLRVASDARFTMNFLQAAKSGHYEDPVLLGLFDCRVCQVLQKRGSGLVRGLQLFRKMTHQLGLGHSSSHESSSVKRVGFVARPPSYTSCPVEKQRLSRIFSGFRWWECPERHKPCPFPNAKALKPAG